MRLQDHPLYPRARAYIIAYLVVLCALLYWTAWMVADLKTNVNGLKADLNDLDDAIRDYETAVRLKKSSPKDE